MAYVGLSCPASLGFPHSHPRFLTLTHPPTLYVHTLLIISRNSVPEFSLILNLRCVTYLTRPPSCVYPPKGFRSYLSLLMMGEMERSRITTIDPSTRLHSGAPRAPAKLPECQGSTARLQYDIKVSATTLCDPPSLLLECSCHNHPMWLCEVHLPQWWW